MAEAHEKAKRDYLAGMKYQEIADKYGVSLSTVKSWKTRYKWLRTKTEKVRIQKKSAVKAVFTAPENEELTEKQQLFCRYFVNNRNATQAYLKAYGCSYQTAGSNGYELLQKTVIRAEVERLKSIRNEAIMLSEDDIVERYMRIAFADMTDFAEFGMEDVPLYDAEGQQVMLDDGSMATTKRNYLNFKGHEQVDGGLICEISLGKSGMKVKLEDRQKALEWLSKYFNMNPGDKHKQWFDKQKIELEREKSKGPDVPEEPLIIRPVYGRVNKDGD